NLAKALGRTGVPRLPGIGQLSPAQIDYMLGSAGGTAATTGARAANLLPDNLQLPGQQQEWPRDLTPAGAFGLERRTSGSQLSDFYDHMQRIRDNSQQAAVDYIQQYGPDSPTYKQATPAQRQEYAQIIANKLSGEAMKAAFPTPSG